MALFPSTIASICNSCKHCKIQVQFPASAFFTSNVLLAIGFHLHMWEWSSSTFMVRAQGWEGTIWMLVLLFLQAAPASEQGFGSIFQQVFWWEPCVWSPATKKEGFLSLGTSMRQQKVGVGHILVLGENTCVGLTVCITTRGCGRKVKKQHEKQPTPLVALGVRHLKKCRKEQRSKSNAIFVTLYWFLFHSMAIFKATIPQIPKMHIAILVGSPVDFG